MVTILEAGNLWMTDVTLQGDGQPGRSDATRGIHVKDFNSRVYAESAPPLTQPHIHTQTARALHAATSAPPCSPDTFTATSSRVGDVNACGPWMHSPLDSTC